MKNNCTIYYFHIHIHKTTRTFGIDIHDRGCGNSSLGISPSEKYQVHFEEIIGWELMCLIVPAYNFLNLVTSCSFPAIYMKLYYIIKPVYIYDIKPFISYVLLEQGAPARLAGTTVLFWSVTEIAILSSLDMFFCFNLPSAVFTRNLPSSRSTHVGVNHFS
jgi:hypothetical protein